MCKLVFYCFFRNFEEKALGQIKSVAPDAYFFRQEKNVCPKENKKGYSLTIEADLSKEGMCGF